MIIHQDEYTGLMSGLDHPLLPLPDRSITDGQLHVYAIYYFLRKKIVDAQEGFGKCCYSFDQFACR
jgi:hypothetical protein